MDRLNNINKTLNAQWNRLQNIRNTVDNTGAQADKARNRVREAEDLISVAREELDKAKEAISKVVSQTAHLYNLTILHFEYKTFVYLNVLVFIHRTSKYPQHPEIQTT